MSDDPVPAERGETSLSTAGYYKLMYGALGVATLLNVVLLIAGSYGLRRFSMGVLVVAALAVLTRRERGKKH